MLIIKERFHNRNGGSLVVMKAQNGEKSQLLSFSHLTVMDEKSAGQSDLLSDMSDLFKQEKKLFNFLLFDRFKFTQVSRYGERKAYMGMGYKPHPSSIHIKKPSTKNVLFP